MAAVLIESQFGHTLPLFGVAYCVCLAFGATSTLTNFNRAVRAYAIVERNDAIFLALLDPFARESYRVLQERERQEKPGENGAAS